MMGFGSWFLHWETGQIEKKKNLSGASVSQAGKCEANSAVMVKAEWE